MRKIIGIIFVILYSVLFIVNYALPPKSNIIVLLLGIFIVVIYAGMELKEYISQKDKKGATVFLFQALLMSLLLVLIYLFNDFYSKTKIVSVISILNIILTFVRNAVGKE